MASAAASRPPAPPPPPPPPPPSAAAMQWLAPRVSFSLDDAGGSMAAGAGGAGKASVDFEFFLAGCSAVSTMLPADELFSGGKLVPLRIPATSSTSSAADGVATRPPLAPAAAQPETPRPEEVEAPKDAAESTAEVEPKVVPARRWRDLLRMRKQQASSSSSSSSTTDTKPLRRLLRRGPKPPEQEPSLNHPLLRDPDEPEKPAPAPTATPPPPSQHHQQLPPKIRLPASQAAAPPPPPPPPPPAVAADSPRLNAAGKVVFNGLGRSSSSPSSLAGGRRHRTGGSGSGGMERSYSAHVRVTPVLNVPVCRKSVSVFGIDRLFSPSSASTAAAAHAAAKKGKVARKDAVVTAAPPPSSQ